MGIMVDFFGDNFGVEKFDIDECKLFDIDMDNFQFWMKVIQLGILFMVKDCLFGEDNSKMSVQFCFESMDDFSLGCVVE